MQQPAATVRRAVTKIESNPNVGRETGNGVMERCTNTYRGFSSASADKIEYYRITAKNVGRPRICRHNIIRFRKSIARNIYCLIEARDNAHKKDAAPDAASDDHKIQVHVPTRDRSLR